ncbi:MAG TPA: AAA family ATPase [Acidimicrobiales bacterium]|nr:AAA family ATPase [Acidimicrobiales bacterium]
MRDVRCPVLVGRESEVEVLVAAIERAADRRGGVVAVLGEAGVGKSRLTTTAADTARSRGMTVLRGRAAASPAPVPYRPVAEAFLSHLRGSAPPAADELEGFRPALSVLVPAWARPGEERPAELSVMLLGEAVLALLRVLAGERGVFVVLEDLHWADPGTLELLDYLVDKLEDIGAVVVATIRAGEGSAAERQTRQFGARRQADILDLDRLAGEGVEGMVSASLGASDLPPELVRSVRDASDGLPFLVEEVLASLLNAGALARTDSGWKVDGPLQPAVPPSFAEVVADRLGALSPQEARVVQTAAVLGERFDWALLRETCEADELAVVAALRRATDVQLLEEDRGARGFRFRHALTRTAVLDTLLLPERSTIGKRALAVVEADGRSGPEHLELSARLAETAGDQRRAKELLLASATASLRTGAVTSALAAAERVVDGGADPDQAVLAHEVLLDGFVCAGDARRVVEVGDRLLALLEATDAPPVRRAEAHLRLARAATAATDWARAVDHLARVEALVPDPGDELAARMQVLRAQVAMGEHRIEDAAGHARRSRDAGTALGLDDLVCEALELLGRASRVRDLDEAEHHFTQALATAERAGLEVPRVRALHELGTIELIRLVEPHRLRAARDGALAIGAPGLAAQAGMHLAVALFVRAELEEARVAAERAVEAAERYRLGLLIPAATTVVGAIDAVRGRPEEAAAAFERARPLMDAEIEATGRGHVLGLAALTVEDRAGALREFHAAEALMPPGSGVARAPYRGVYALLQVLEDGTSPVLDELVRDAPSLHVAGLALVDVARAVVAGRRGDAVGAEQLFAAAMELLAPAPWYRNVAVRLAAEAAIADGWGRAPVWLREALEFFEGEGLDDLARACRSLLRRAGAPVPRRAAGADQGLEPDLARLGVTPREADVLTLVAEGLSNKEIATRLYVSARTVEKHVERLMMKTGAANRAQLAALAARARAVRT